MRKTKYQADKTYYGDCDSDLQAPIWRRKVSTMDLRAAAGRKAALMKKVAEHKAFENTGNNTTYSGKTFITERKEMDQGSKPRAADQTTAKNKPLTRSTMGEKPRKAAVM